MKTKHIALQLLFILLCVFSSKAQNKIHTYRGSYTINKLYQGRIENTQGYAEYEYKDAPDGSRIYEGLFEWIDDKTYPKEKIQGIFKNNRQVDRWEWYYYGNDGWKLGSYVTFNENGKLNGPFSVPGISGEFKNGRLYGKIQYNRSPYPYHAVIKLTGYYGENGKRIGTWDVTEQGESFKVIFNENGEEVNCGYRDKNQDWVWIHFPFTKDLESNVLEYIREYFLLRDSKKVAF